MRHYDQLHESDPDLASALADEVARQQETLTLIASENHASQSVLTAQGSVLTNKYAEGYPDERYYAGCEYADEIEQLAITRAKDLWGAEHERLQVVRSRQHTRTPRSTARPGGLPRICW